MFYTISGSLGKINLKRSISSFNLDSTNMLAKAGNFAAIYEGDKLMIFCRNNKIYEGRHSSATNAGRFGQNMAEAKDDTRLFLIVDSDKIFIADDEWGLLKFPIGKIGYG